MIILPMTDSSQAAVLAGRLMTAITAGSACLMEGKRPLTVSIGIAAYPADADEGADLIQRADEALYSAKRRGKNRAVEYRESGKD